MKEVTIDDKQKLLDALMLRRTGAASTNIVSLYLWMASFPLWYEETEYGLILISKDDDGKFYSYTPKCRKENLNIMFHLTEEYLESRLNTAFRMYLVDREALSCFDLPDGKYRVTEDRDNFDYLYEADSLRTFSGKKYHSKKNHYNFFVKNYCGMYEYRELGAADDKQLLKFIEEWEIGKTGTDEFALIKAEEAGIKFLLNYRDFFEYKIGGVFVNNQLKAFTIGNYIPEDDTVYISCEKADRNIRGLYPFICSEFLKNTFPDALYVNREDDMGLCGLRKSKMSYKPVKLIEKFTVTRI